MDLVCLLGEGSSKFSAQWCH